jgi:signal transduction histidine kinase/ActR/RegA family two-component response regulator
MTADDRDSRLLLLAPTSRDAAMTVSFLGPAGVDTCVCQSFDELIAELRAGAAAILISEEAVSSGHNAALASLLAAQPPWSDLPVLVLTRIGADSGDLSDAVRTLGNVTLLERPVRVQALISAVKTALRARERQYQIRGHLADRARAEIALRTADQRKDDFLATLGHELRNPLAPLVSALPLLKQATKGNPTGQRVIAAMDRQIGHLVRLVDDLLEVSRITRGRIDVRRQPLDLVQVVRSAIEMTRAQIENAGLELIADVAPAAVYVEGDAVRLTQVFANLLANAAKYTNHGGHIWITVEASDTGATVAVRDDGIGIAADQLESVFDMFTQIDRSNRRTQGGLGIGLTLARSLVAMHNGRSEARSDGAGMGSEFVVRLPTIRAGRLLPAPTAAADDDAPFPHRRVLVVDDNLDAAETLGQLLTELGATVCVVHNGRDALDSLASFNPDAVLLDIGMPEMDGYEVSRRIRQRPDYRDLLVIALTGWGQAQDRTRSKAAGFDHHIVKPPDIAKLRAILMAPPPAAPHAPTQSAVE